MRSPSKATAMTMGWKFPLWMIASSSVDTSGFVALGVQFAPPAADGDQPRCPDYSAGISLWTIVRSMPWLRRMSLAAT
jgi:hypothetical protein